MPKSKINPNRCNTYKQIGSVYGFYLFNYYYGLNISTKKPKVSVI